MKKTILKTIYNLGGFAPFHWATRGGLGVLMYHRFSFEANAHKISAKDFAVHLAYLKKHCRVLSLTEAVERLSDDTLPPNAVVITIDDGYADSFEIAFPLLKQFDLPATVYAVTDFLDNQSWLWTDLMRYVLLNAKKELIEIEFADGEKIAANLSAINDRYELAGRINARLKKLPNAEKDAKIAEIAEALKVEIPEAPTKDYAPISWTQARVMDACRIEIESHTATHPILTNINETALDFELQTSKARLENQLQKTIKHFCYPNGNTNKAVKAAVKRAGYQSATTTEYGFNDKTTDQFLLRRFDAPAAIENFAQTTSGFEALRKTAKI